MGHLIQWVSLFFFQIPHKSSMGHLFRCGSSIYSFLIDSHTSPLWVACFGVDHLFFSFRISLKSSMGRLFRCESSILLLSVLTQVLCGSLVSVWIICSSLIGSHTGPLWVACFGVVHLFFSYRISHKSSIGSLVLFSICTCACACMCMCTESLCREITPPATLLQWEVKAIFVFIRMPLIRLSKCFASSRSGAVDLALRLHSIAVSPIIDPHSP